MQGHGHSLMKAIAEFDSSVMHLGDFSGRVETEPHTLSQGLGDGERLEILSQILRRDAVARVAHPSMPRRGTCRPGR